MGYYQGDYYRGDYYRGDPGLFSWAGKLLKKGFRRAAGVVGAVLPGPAGIVARRVTRALGPPPPPGPRLPMGPRAAGAVVVSPFGAAAVAVDGKPARVGMTAEGCCPSGYHPVKSGEGYCVRNRSMNVANPRALRRGLRRVAGFAKLARRARTDIKRAARAVS